MKNILEKIKNKKENESDKHLCTVYWCVLDDAEEEGCEAKPLHTEITEKSMKTTIELWGNLSEDEQLNLIYKTAYKDYLERTGFGILDVEYLKKGNELCIEWEVLDPYVRCSHFLTIDFDCLKVSIEQFNNLSKKEVYDKVVSYVEDDFMESTAFEIISMVHVLDMFGD